MDAVWLVTGVILMLAGLAGSVLPFLPGPPLCFAALLLQQLREVPPYTGTFLILWGAITAGTVVLDYVIPLIGTRHFGGTRYGMWGCMIGLIGGFWLGPLGLIIGPFAGALAGELLAHADSDRALRAALGSFAGFVAGTLIKLVACVVMAWYFITAF